MPEEPRDLLPLEQNQLSAPSLEELLPLAPIDGLTASEIAKMQQLQVALVQIGSAAGGALVCPGNQVGVSESSRCPYSAKCELLKRSKAPEGELCPIEREVILARFNGWAATINANPRALREDQRAVISELVWIDVQEQRCSSILSKGEAARLTQISVKDSNPETGEWISWERVIHSNSVLLESLHTRRRMIMKEWMLTPEQKFKAAKALGKLGNTEDLGKKLSSRADRLASLDIDVIDAEIVEDKNNLPSR